MDDKHLAWFLGPKAENSELFIDTLMAIIQDYIHWRRNYYPSDNLLITKKMQREHEEEYDKLYQNVTEMMSLLRRNFPFYSPRYIAHMLSDVSMPSMLGYFAGMLYNSNNITPEAAPVTVEWEIEACNEVLKMLGYKPSPTPPKEESSRKDWEHYEKELKTQFGWAHITSGGTVANIEALWVARIVKYFPLAIQEVAKAKNLDIEIKKSNAEPDEDSKDIKELSTKEVIGIKPNESIYLYAKFIDSIKRAEQTTDIVKASAIAAKLLDECEYSLGSHLGKIFSDFPPVIFTSGAAHYSVKKAADILGIGRNNVIIVNTDSQFRMDVEDLEKKINFAINQGKTPLAVVAVGSTTEEGAVDPVHEILDLREKFQKEKNLSFWIHVDSAWGGYISSLFRLEEHEEIEIILEKVFHQLKIFDTKNLSLPDKAHRLTEILFTQTDETERNNFLFDKNDLTYIHVLSRRLVEKKDPLSEYLHSKLSTDTQNVLTEESNKNSPTKKLLYAIKDLNNVLSEPSLYKFASSSNIILSDKINQLLEQNQTEENIIQLNRLLLESIYPHETKTTLEIFHGRVNSLSFWAIQNDYVSFVNEFRKLIEDFGSKVVLKDTKSPLNSLLDGKCFELTLTDRSDETSEFVSDKITIELNNYKEERLIKWGGKPLISAFLAFKNADSITVDPHKMGYIQYPCGVVAFKNDRVRHFIMQRAPYITASGHNALIHNPPRHIKNIDFEKLREQSFPYDVYQIGTDAFAPFILEGSKPGAAAASLWLASKTIPLNRKNHGLIIKSSLLAAREIYEWLNSWNKFAEKALGKNLLYEFMTFGAIPDTNVVVFIIKDKNNETIEGINKLTEQVYNYFSIQAELGAKRHSYSQPFFISKTKMEQNYYNFDSFEDFFNNCDLRDAKKDYIEKGLVILRATIMNPYITSIRQNTDQNLIKEFVMELHKAAQESAKRLIREE
jgi:glutamate/tyrosine decarboxylase-like PLP-dependent enzyme